VLGSFVAGSTPAGGGAVAFPVFTKLLGVASSDARTFGLMIQSVGMSMASLLILSRGIRVYWSVLRWAVPAGITGLVMGTFWWQVGDPYPRLVFSSVAVVFGAALVISHWWLKWEPDEEMELRVRWGRGGVRFVVAGFLGGVMSSMVGSGIDVLIFVVMALSFGLHERRAIPTSVLAMATLSVVGVGLRLAHSGEEVLSSAVVDYWLVCVPVVAIGAPLGAWVVSHSPRHLIVVGLLALICGDFVSTLWIVEFSLGMVGVMVITGMVALVCFWLMLRGRGRIQRSEPEVFELSKKC